MTRTGIIVTDDVIIITDDFSETMQLAA